MVKAKGKRVPRLRRNYQLAPGVMRFSSSRMYSKRGLFIRKRYPVVVKTIEKKKKFVVKPIGGEKNGGERKVPIKKKPRFLPEREYVRKTRHNRTKKVPLRSSIKPGTILIILVGRHKGKRVIFLKQLPKSGLLLVTGPLKINSMPLRRIAQAFVIATKTSLDITGLQIPEHINDDYFRRINRKKEAKKGDTNIFAQGTEEYKVSEIRKADQKQVDKQILEIIRKHPEHKFMFGYLGSKFSLAKNQYPHQMIF